MLAPPARQPQLERQSQPAFGPYVSRIRFQLGGAIIVAVLLPAIIRWPNQPLPLQPGGQMNTMVGTFLAIAVGYAIVRRLAVFPGIQSTQFILPVIGLSHLTLIALLFFLRLDYARFHILASFAIATAWFYFIAMVETRLKRQRFLVLPFGHTRELLSSDQVQWSVLKEPSLPSGSWSGIVADLRAEMSDAWQAFLADSALKGFPVYHTKQVAEMLTGRVQIEHLSENNLGSLLPSSLYLRIKRLGDLGLLCLLLPLLLPLGTAIGLAVRMTSPGPVLFTQDRIGLGGRRFRMLKFRTMVPNHSGHIFTASEDDRITSLGVTLRKYRLDELPQAWNILRGDMSWIGPRPEQVEPAQSYRAEVPFYSYRHIVRPGITGWAQVRHGYAADADGTASKLQYDFYYIKYFSIWLDLLIAALTIRVVLTGRGAR